MRQAVVVLAAAVLWLVVATRARTFTRNATQRLLWAALVALAVGMTLEISVVAASVARFPGTPTNALHLVKHVLVIVAAGLVVEVARNLALPPRDARRGRVRRAVGQLVVVILLVELFAAAPVHDSELEGLTTAAGGEPALLAYWAVYVLALGSAEVRIAVVAWSSVRTFPAGTLRNAMGVMGLGASVGLLYCFNKVAFLVSATITHGSWPDAEVAEQIQSVLLAATVVVMAAGLLWPVVAEWPLVRRLAALRTYRQLNLLWRSYYEAEPSIALDGAAAMSPMAAGGLRDIELRLYRRVIEIRDGMLAVRQYAHGRTRELAQREAHSAGLRDPDLVAEAAWLEVGRRAKMRGGSPYGDAPAAPSGGADLNGEVQVLTRIARSRPAIEDVVDRVEAALAVHEGRQS